MYDLMKYVGSGVYEEVDGLIRKVNSDAKHRSKQRHRMSSQGETNRVPAKSGERAY